MSDDTMSVENMLPNPSAKKDSVFKALSLIAIIVNLVWAVINYALLSHGVLLENLYEFVDDANLNFPVIFGGGGAGVLFTITAYIFSFDFRRKKRPAAFLYPLISSLAIMIAASVLGNYNITTAEILYIVGALAICLVLPIGILLIEKSIGLGSKKSAEKLIKAKKYSAAKSAARMALSFYPNDKSTLINYGLGLAGSENYTESLPYLNFAEKQSDTATPELHLALANSYERTGNKAQALHFFRLYKENVSFTPDEADRLIALLLAVEENDTALNEIKQLSPERRIFWREDYENLLLQSKDFPLLMELYEELKADEPPPHPKALSLLQNVHAVFPENTDVLRKLIESYTASKNNEKAAHYMQALLELDERDDTIRRRLIDYHWKHDDKENVINHLNKLLILNQATVEDKIVLLEENYSHGDYFRVEELVNGESDLSTNAQALGTLALALYGGERYDEALEKIAEAKKHEPAPELLRSLDGLAARIKKHVLGVELEEYKSRSASAPENMSLKFEYLNRLLAAGQSERVVLELEEIVRKRPDELSRVEQEIRLMLSANGKDLRLMDYLADLSIRNGQFDRAYETFEKRAAGEMDSSQLLHDGAERIIQANPRHLKSLLSEVRYYREVSAPNRALSFLDKYLEAGGDRTKEIDLLEMELASAGKHPERAKEAGLRLISAGNPDPALLMQMAEVEAEAKDWKSAIEHASAAVAADSENFSFRKKLKTIVQDSKEHRRSIVVDLLKTDPSNRRLLHELGDIYHDFDKLNDAVAAYQKASLNDPDQRIARTKLGYVLVKKEMYSDAEDVLKDVDIPHHIDIDEQDSLKSLLYTIAQAYENADQEEKALELYRRIFRVDAGYKGVLEQVEKLQHLDKKKKKSSEYQ